MDTIRALLFDKDGTLFDFQATWGGWAVALIRDLAGGDPQLSARLARRVRIDLLTERFFPDSPVIAGTTETSVDAMLPELPHMSFDTVRDRMVEAAQSLQPVAAVPLSPLLSGLKSDGYTLGVATNDSERASREQLHSMNVLSLFDFLCGADSGHGAKPAPGQCLAFADAIGLRPSQVVMIGDSTHDLAAGASAGMRTIGVLTGPASKDELAPLADAVLTDIGHLPTWLEEQG